MKQEYVFNAVVDRVVDGDTFDLVLDLGFGICVKERVRLFGFNAYESSLRDGQNQEEKQKGIEAKNFCKKKLEGRKVVLHSQEFKKGKYGRILGTVYLDGENFTNTLKKKGYERK